VLRRRLFRAMLLVSLILGLAGPSHEALAQQPYDLLIKGGRLLDGSGNPWYYADVAVRGDRIVAVGDLAGAQARRVIDARGLYVAPGFIDDHSHAGPGLATPELSGARPLLAQGITTVVVNPDGGGPVDLAAQRAALLKDGLGVNVAQYVPHGSVRAAVLGMSDRDPAPAELDRMRALVKAGMESGAFGLSSGPFYAPGSYSKTSELVALAKVAAQYGGVYESHIRDESDYTVGIIAAVDEVIAISREAKLPSIVAHIKALGPHVWGYSMAVVQRIQRARDAGLEVFADQYPYTASSTSLGAALLPRWAQAGGDSALQRRLKTPADLARIRAAMVDNLERRGGADRLQIARYVPDPSIDGHTLEAVAQARGEDPIDAAIALIQGGGAGVVSFNMLDADVDLFMRQPWTMTCSDGTLVRMGEGVPHPRAYGTFPRKLQVYALDRHVISLPAAVRSMTSLTATVFHMQDRGVIRPGAFADITVFDPTTLRDVATYQQPHQLAQGMVYVLVNGKLAIDDRKLTDGRYGVVLSRR
jgi:N-acyl-D-amino-acid deacylase